MAQTTKRKSSRTAATKPTNKPKRQPAAIAAPQPVAGNKPGSSFKLRLPKRPSKDERQIVIDSRTKLPSAYRLLAEAFRILVRHWRLFAGILVIYALLTLVLVGGVSGGTDLQSLKGTVSHVFKGQFNQLGTGLTLFVFLVGSTANTSSAVASSYQTMLLLLVSVILIWSLRQVYAGHVVRTRDAFYQGTYPIVQFILVLCVVGVGLLPLVLGAALYGTVAGTGIAVGALEKGIFGGIALLLVLLSTYFITSSIIALYIVTLPDMTPMKALRAARELVRFRRWVVLRKLLFLPIAVLVLMALIVVPFAVAFTSLAVGLFFAVSTIAIAVIHSYMYALYRALL